MVAAGEQAMERIETNVSDIVTSLATWMREVSLPFWARNGIDPRTGLFHERMLPDGMPDGAAPLRARVQFRQVYSLSHAAIAGWLPDGGQIALAAWEKIVARFHGRGGEPGFVHVLAPDGSVADARRDSYDHAFAVLALAWLVRATGDAQARAMLDGLLAFVDEHLTDPAGALLEGLPHAPPRRQNPQMHWFEAMLALHEAIGHPQGLARAAFFRRLFEERLYDSRTRTLGEHFEADWQPAGRSVEPGHLAEWTWLLRTHERLAGLERGGLASDLLASALRAADPATGLLVDEVDAGFAVRRGTRRSWLQTELCKAWIAEAEVGRPGAADAARGALEALARHHLFRPFPAGWIDQLDEAARPVPGPVPASILYHVLVAVLEADRVLGRGLDAGRAAARPGG